MKQLRIKTFNIGWWFYIILTIICLILLSTLKNKITNIDHKYNLVLIISVIEYIILRIYKFSLKDIRPDYNYYNELPCYLCNQSTIMCILACLTRNTGIMAYCVSVGTIGALLAIFLPDRYNIDQLFFSKQAFGFYGYHCLLIISCLSFYFLGLYNPKPSDAIYSVAYTIILVIIAHIINLILVTTKLNPISNYAFTMYPDNSILDKLYKILPVKLFYLVPISLIFGLMSYILFSIL